MRSIILLVGMCVGPAQAANLDLKCVASEVEHIHQFELEASIDVQSEEFVEQDVRMELYDRRHHSVRVESMSLSGQVEVVETGNTLEPFVHVRVLDMEQDIFMQLNLNFPGQLNSKLRYQGVTYRSTCVELKTLSHQ